MKHTILTFCLLCLGFTAPAYAQSFRYLDLSHGLSHNEVYAICQDRRGYTWMLTQGGVDRYNGKSFKHFELDRQEEFLLAAHAENMQMVCDKGGSLVITGLADKVFRFDELRERFDKVTVAESSEEVVQHNVDRVGCVWASDKGRLYGYSLRTGQTRRVPNVFRNREEIRVVEQGADSYMLYIATTGGVYRMDTRHGERVQCITKEVGDAHRLFYHPQSHCLVVAPLSGGLYLYAEGDGRLTPLMEAPLTGVTVNQIVQDNKHTDELLLATEGAGVCRLHLPDRKCSVYIAPNEALGNKMNSNIVRALYMENNDRLWMAVSPYGVTIFSYKYPPYRWIIHATENAQSLGNNLVNRVYEDSDGDIWYLTGNGISLYRTRLRTWTHFLQSKQTQGNSVFLSLCETERGVFLAGGAFNGVYAIRKNDLSYQHYTSKDWKQEEVSVSENRYIRSLYKDAEGQIWMGGYYFLACANPVKGEMVRVKIQPRTTCLCERDPHRLWVGSTDGLFVVDIRSKRVERMKGELAHRHITTIYRLGGMTYIGTKNHGLYILDANLQVVKHMNKGNSALLSNHITNIQHCYSGKTNSDYYHEYRSVHCSMPEDVKGEITGHYLMVCTEQEIAVLSTYHGEMKIWPKDQGVMKLTFNDHSAVHTSGNRLILGSNYGAIELPDTILLPENKTHEIRIEDIMVNDVPYTGSKDEEVLKLKADERNLCVEVNCINYENPSDVVIRWRLKEDKSGWHMVNEDSEIRLNGLSSGTHTLLIEARSKGNRDVLTQKTIQIQVATPLWCSPWMILLYLLILGALVFVLLRDVLLRRRNRNADREIHWLLQKTEEIETSLTRIHYPLLEMMQKPNIDREGKSLLQMVITNSNRLAEIVTQILHKERVAIGLKTNHPVDAKKNEPRVHAGLCGTNGMIGTDRQRNTSGTDCSNGTNGTIRTDRQGNTNGVNETNGANKIQESASTGNYFLPVPDVQKEEEILFLERVEESISRNLYRSDYTVDVLCKDMGMSRSALLTKMKLVAGCAPGDFIRMHRLKKAETMLLARIYSISEVSDRCGFGDAKYFREVFKKYYNMSPTEYIQKNKEKQDGDTSTR